MNLEEKTDEEMRALITDMVMITKTMLEGNTQDFTLDELTMMLRSHKKRWSLIAMEYVKAMIQAMEVKITDDVVTITDFHRGVWNLTEVMLHEGNTVH